MKKSVSIALAFVLLIVFVFAGCKSNDVSSDSSGISDQISDVDAKEMEDPIFTDEVTSETVVPFIESKDGGTSETGFGRVAILGDSYSTFKGMMAGSYTCWYEGGEDCKWEIPSADLTWWGIVIKDTNSQLVCNSSFSGAAVSRMRYGTYTVESSFPERLKKDIDLTKIDTLFILGCTNDSWGNSPLGELKYSGFTENDLNYTIPSYCYMLDYIKKKAPDVRVINIMNSSLKSEISENIEKASKHYGYEFLQLSDDLDKEKLEGHPTAAGMRMIADQVKTLLK